MLFAKSTLVVALFALSNVATASTPACLLQVVGPENPGDLKGICKTNGDDIQSSLRDACGDDAQEALKFYSSVCKDAGFNVDISTPTTSSSSSPSSSATSSSDSGTSTDNPSSTDSESASNTDSSEDPSETNGASSDKQVSAAAFAAVVFLGFAATL
ncbi:putative GPI anchored cell wall protein [Aspergillus lucknowensis]|uniref:GPI anchored cell wall protein n=1 Tax=Aspergillus lucknowensis TaxID=176173 RepID=A0ABR4LUP1_9EURO